MKENKSTTIKRRSLKKASMVKDKSIEVVTIRKSDVEIDPDVSYAIERKRKEEHDEGRTRSSFYKSRGPMG